MYIPWGSLQWLKMGLPDRRWTFIGCLAHEDRSLAAFDRSGASGADSFFVRIFDDDTAFPAEEKESLDRKRKEAIERGVPPQNVIDSTLFASLDEIESSVLAASKRSTSIILDISTFPKRWFFPLIRFVLSDGLFTDVVATYTGVSSYAPELASNPEVVKPIPTFIGREARTQSDYAFISVGFHAYSILNLFDSERPKNLLMLFPFPPGPPSYMRNWRFVERFERAIKVPESDNNIIEHLRISALDAPQNFSAMMNATNFGESTSFLAPFGPKPVSLAMCLFALYAERTGRPSVPIYYSQPRSYSLSYSSGMAAGVFSTAAYPLKLSNRILYDA